MTSSELPPPPPPWLLRGRVIVVPARAARATAAVKGVPTLAGRRGRSPGGLVLARYGGGSTLHYSELLAIGGLARVGRGAAFWTPLARVDDSRAAAAGQAPWGLPRQLATFAWTSSGAGAVVEVLEADALVVRVAVAARRRRWPLPILAPFASADASRVAIARGWLHAGPARVRVEVPPGSPLARLELGFSGVGLEGEVRLRVSAPRRPAGVV